MKKLIGLLLVIALITISCEKDNSFEQMIGTYECTLYVNDVVYVPTDGFKYPYTVINPTVDYYKRCTKVRWENGNKIYEIWVKVGK